jgi:phosphatidylglycerol---prolipoprotein diacylglyceryl transferase
MDIFAAFLVIDIGLDPTLTDIGPFMLTWHGLFTAIGIIAGVTLSVWLAKRDGIPAEVGQEIALVGVPAAIVGARLFYVVEHWDKFSDDLPGIVFGVTEGGITLYGGLIGGALAGVIYAIWKKLPVGIALDAAAPGMLLGQALGRVGDLINGEHAGTASDLPWAVRYTNTNTGGELGVSVHPTAGGYELLGDLAILAILLFVAYRYIKRPGWIFCGYLLLYAPMRFGLSEFRLDEATIGSVSVPQIVSIILFGLGIILAGVLRNNPGPITQEWEDRVHGIKPEEPPEPATS